VGCNMQFEKLPIYEPKLHAIWTACVWVHYKIRLHQGLSLQADRILLSCI